MGGGSQDGGTTWKLFVCLTSMKYSPTNTKPSCTPRKLTGGLTQQCAQHEPQNSAGTEVRRGELGEGETAVGREPLLGAERGWRWRGRIWEKHPSPKAAGDKVEIGKRRSN